MEEALDLSFDRLLMMMMMKIKCCVIHWHVVFIDKMSVEQA